jgi:hypothetical protein
MMKRFVISIVAIGSAAVLGQTALFAQPADNANDQAGKCQVTIDRSQEPGVFDVTRQSYENGECICYAYTGPATQPVGTENRVSALLASRTCPSAKPMLVPGAVGGAVAGGGFPIPTLIGLGVIGGAAAAALGGDEENPVSP